MQKSHWQSKNPKGCGVDDMVLLTTIDEKTIAENLQNRLKNDLIYSYIGPVLVAVNPFKNLSYFTDKEIDIYNGSAIHENPPHVYALCNEMFKNMVIDNESQCVIISGESGAGKTVNAKFIMSYISKVSGGSGRVVKVKDIINKSNPLLEAFGNAKTLRNDNSSRFGKYVEILFVRGGEPNGGRISSFLLEKSRVVSQYIKERSFHIFYQIICGCSPTEKKNLGLVSVDYFNYLNQTGCTTIEHVDDSAEYKETINAMKTMEISQDIIDSILKILAAILHLGNITFRDEANKAIPNNDEFLEFPAYLLEIDAKLLKTKLTSRVMESKWGKQTEVVQMVLNTEQAAFTRDALSKSLYAKIFDYLIASVNKAIDMPSLNLLIGILDIYGFEIFENNGFDQFCINYVNEKLQQIFIELTLKSEQEEYVQEGIKWTPINYFNNKVVCDLIESKQKPVGIMSVLDDVCATMHATGEGADNKLMEDLSRTVASSELFVVASHGFSIIHYAGRVNYSAGKFCERNRDVLFVDLIEMIKTSKNRFIVVLFPEDISGDKRGRPTTVSMKMKTQANQLVDRLTSCIPHYIRCIKPNETKKPGDFDFSRVKHQVEYLGLKENIRVRRAGFAFRRPFDKVLQRYGILSNETFPSWKGELKDGIKHLLTCAKLDPDEWQVGKSKVFIKKPESVFLLEEMRERKFDAYARIIQKVWRNFHNQNQFIDKKNKATDLLSSKKQRRKNSINRNFFGDYLGIENLPHLRAFLEKKEIIEFADSIDKFDRRFKIAKRDLIVSNKFIYIIGREKITKGPQKGTIIDILKRKTPIDKLLSLELSTYSDNFIVINVQDDYSNCFTCNFKVELVYVLSCVFFNTTKRNLAININQTLKFTVKKEGFGGGSQKIIEFIESPSIKIDTYKSSGSKLTVTTASGLPPNSRPQHKDSRAKPKSSSNYFQIQKQIKTSRTSTSATESNDSFVKKSVDLPTKPAKELSGPKCRALWEYIARDADEMTIQAGDIITILSKDESGWWVGFLSNKKGLFPSNYVELI